MTMVKNFFLKRFFYSDKVINNIVGSPYVSRLVIEKPFGHDLESARMDQRKASVS
jgi:glucose-6-phosphate 1-dehydrogenase